MSLFDTLLVCMSYLPMCKAGKHCDTIPEAPSVLEKEELSPRSTGVQSFCRMQLHVFMYKFQLLQHLPSVSCSSRRTVVVVGELSLCHFA